MCITCHRCANAKPWKFNYFFSSAIVFFFISHSPLSRLLIPPLGDLFWLIKLTKRERGREKEGGSASSHALSLSLASYLMHHCDIRKAPKKLEIVHFSCCTHSVSDINKSPLFGRERERVKAKKKTFIFFLHREWVSEMETNNT